MFTIIYPYRNRDIQRVKNSLNSLQQQTNTAFTVYFVNYGSDATYTKQIENLIANYSFLNYSYLYTEQQPWNKSKAINSVLKKLEEGYFFVADIDMIFDEKFVEKAIQLSKTNEAWYFQVGFLSEEESKTSKKFEDYQIKFKSNNEATGLTICPVKAAKNINGFDEFYHFWGSEDTDFHIRLKNSECYVNFYNDDLLMLHQWHEIYRNKETKNLSNNLQIIGIIQYNHFYLKQVIQTKKTKVNNKNWGETQSKKQYEDLLKYSEINSLKISNDKTKIDYFLFQELPNLSLGLHSFEIYEDDNYNSLKTTIKNSLKKNKSAFYSLKTINDKLLFSIIHFYKNYHYNYSISKDLKSIKFVINKF